MSDNRILNLAIRKATLKDADIIMKIQKNDGHKHAYYLTRARLRELFERGESFFIAFLGDEGIGFAAADIEIRARLHFLSVMRRKQKMGIGTALLEKIISESKKCRAKMLYVYIEPGSALEKFLKKRDFKKAGYFRDRFGKGKHANIFNYNL